MAEAVEALLELVLVGAGVAAAAAPDLWSLVQDVLEAAEAASRWGGEV